MVSPSQLPTWFTETCVIVRDAGVMSGNCSLVNYRPRDTLSSHYAGQVGLLAVTILLLTNYNILRLLGCLFVVSRYHLSHASCGSVRNLDCVPIKYLAKWVPFGEGRVHNLEEFCPKVCLDVPGKGGVEPGDLPAPVPLPGGAGVAGGGLGLVLQDVLVACLLQGCLILRAGIVENVFVAREQG